MKTHNVTPLTFLLVLCTVTFAIASPDSAQAQDWRFEPVIRVGGEYDDNASLNVTTGNEVELSGYLLDARADIFYSSPTTKFFLQPRARLRNYPDEPAYDSDDYFLRSNLSHKGELNTLGFRVNFDRQSVRTAERSDVDLEVDDPDEITDDDSGRTFLFGTRNKWRLSPYWDYQFSNVSSIGVDFDYFDVSYEDIVANSLQDYTDARLNLNYRRSFSSLTTGVLTVTGRRFDTTAAQRDINSYGVMLGFERKMSEKTRLTVMIGAEEIDQSELDSDPEVVGYVTLVRNLERTRMFAQYRRSIQGSGSGRLSVRDFVNINFLRRLNRKISAGIGVRAYRSRGTGASLSFDDREYVQIGTSLVWYLTKAFVIEADYNYTILDRDNSLTDRSKSNRVILWFVYQPKSDPKI